MIGMSRAPPQSFAPVLLIFAYMPDTVAMPNPFETTKRGTAMYPLVVMSLVTACRQYEAFVSTCTSVAATPASKLTIPPARAGWTGVAKIP